jgi:hypothetical protein
VRFVEAWAFDDQVKNLFKVPCCVLIARKEQPGALPKKITAYTGELPRRDATASEAGKHLTRQAASWPKPREDAETAYGSRFRQGATGVPRMLFVVTRVVTGRFGGDVNRPVVESRRAQLEKLPSRELEPLQGPI